MAGTFESSEDVGRRPYWWDAAPPVQMTLKSLPPHADIVVIGAGITGASAALHLAQGGREVLVLDAGDVGGGAARRSVGLLNRLPKKSLSSLIATRGEEWAIRYFRERDSALAGVLELVERERIDCHLEMNGRFIGACSPAHLEHLHRECELRRQHLGHAFEFVPRERQSSQIATNVFYGGVVVHGQGSLHPGLYHQGLVDAAIRYGAKFSSSTPVTGITGGRGAFAVATDRGTVRAREVVLATNGYTSRGFEWFARRLIPFHGYVVATDTLRPEVIRAALPGGRAVMESNFDAATIRIAPDSPRILFCGATGTAFRDAEGIGRRLMRLLRGILKDLPEVKFSHVWSGRCAGTFDFAPHIGRHEGIWYGMGYNFGGIPMGTHFGAKIARQILGDEDSETIFQEADFPAHRFYDGNPWFVPYAMKYFRLKDAINNLSSSMFHRADHIKMTW